MKELLKVLTVDQAKATIIGALEKRQIETEDIRLEDALGRTIAENIVSEDRIPSFSRSTVDGYAVQAKDSFGASEGMPLPVEVVGEVLMGKEVSGKVKPGQAFAIPTGGMLPDNCDAVVMLEYTNELDNRTIEVYKAVAPGENVVKAGEDLEVGEEVLVQGSILRPQDLGVLAALGKDRIKVYKKCKVGILSTGDEVVSISEKPLGGQVRDINSYAILGLVQEAGGIGTLYGIIPDEEDQLRYAVKKALDENDIVVVSGGSSVGTKDATAKIFQEFCHEGLLFHGISIKPGKPTILAKTQNKLLFGLPGHPVSAMVVFNIFGKLAMDIMMGREGYRDDLPIKGVLTKNIPSSPGREEYIRVKVEKGKEGNEGNQVTPKLGKSGLITTMVEANAFLVVPLDKQGYTQGQEVDVHLFRRIPR